jgi:hypothetical protein
MDHTNEMKTIERDIGNALSGGFHRGLLPSLGFDADR